MASRRRGAVMRRSRFSEELIVRILQQPDKESVAEVAKRRGMSESSIYPWLKRCGVEDVTARLPLFRDDVYNANRSTIGYKSPNVFGSKLALQAAWRNLSPNFQPEETTALDGQFSADENTPGRCICCHAIFQIAYPGTERLKSPERNRFLTWRSPCFRMFLNLWETDWRHKKGHWQPIMDH